MRKPKLLLLLLYMLSTLLVLSCAEEDDPIPHITDEEYNNYVDSHYDASLCYFQNNALPVGKESLRVLAIGNSYTTDGVMLLNELFTSCGITSQNCCVYAVTSGGASLEYWANMISNDSDIVAHRFAGSLNMGIRNGTLKEILSCPWDVVVLQQYSGNALQYSTFNPYLRELIDAIRNNCTNPDVVIAWQMVWAYSTKEGTRPVGEERWKRICMATKQQMIEDGIDVVIPTGTAIQNGRCTSLCDIGELTTDNIHLNRGVGRYIAACTWFETLFAPVFGCSMYGCDAVYAITDDDISVSKYAPIPVDASNNFLCQKCAYMAVRNWFHISQIE